MTELERRYRRILRLLPAHYRRAWEQDMVTTFLASALPADPEDAEFAAEYGRPDWSEVASVVGLAVRLRLGGAGAPPRSLAWGEAARRVALVGLLVHAVDALAGAGSLLWLPVRFPDFAAPDRTATAWTLLGLGWVAAYLALVVGRWRAARLLAGLSLLPAVITAWVDLAETGGAYLASRTAGLLVAAVPVLALAAFHRDAVPVKPRPWLVALPVGVTLVTVVLLLTQYPSDWVLLDWPGLASAAVFTAALAYQIAPNVGWGGPSASWATALTLLTLTTLGLRAVTLLDYLEFTTPAPGRDTLITATIVEGIALLVIAAPLAVRAATALHNLPAAADPAAPSITHPKHSRPV